MGSARSAGAAVLALFAITSGHGAQAPASIPESPSAWVARYDGGVDDEDSAFAIATSRDGARVFVTGRSGDGEGSYDYSTVAYRASSGEQLWSDRYNGPGNGWDQATSLAVSPDGVRMFVTGQSPSVAGSHDYATIAYAVSTGKRLWTARYSGAGSFFDLACSVEASPDGRRVFVTGFSTLARGGTDIVTIAYGASTGKRLWIARYNGPAPAADSFDDPCAGLSGNANDHVRSVAVSKDSSLLYVSGWSRGPRGAAADYVTIAYRASTGRRLWVARYDGPEQSVDVPHGISLSANGARVFVTGYSYPSTCSVACDADYVTIAYRASNGSRLWVARFDGPAHSYDSPSSIAVSREGSRVFVTGTITSACAGACRLDFATVAYRATTGAVLWSATYGAPGMLVNDARAVAPSPDGAVVYVTGMSDLPRASYATLAYRSSDGKRLWVARFSGDGQIGGGAQAIAAARDRIYVTGGTEGPFRLQSDYVTVAYSATTCGSGRNESGPLSGSSHEIVEPSAGAAAPFIHGLDCDLVAENGA